MVEHSDPLQETADTPDPSGRATVDGATEAMDRASTQTGPMHLLIPRGAAAASQTASQANVHGPLHLR